MKDYYSILGVSSNVSQDVLEAVYKKYKKEFGNNPEAKERMEQIEEAYRVLSDPEQRVEYDRKISSAHNTMPFNNNNHIAENNNYDKFIKTKKLKIVISIIVLTFIVFAVLTLLMNSNVTANSIWGTFKTDSGELVSVEMVNDFGDNYYTAYITSSDVPWVKNYVTIDIDSGIITAPYTSESVSYNIKGKKLTFSSEVKEFKKISNECMYDEILNKNLMTLDALTGTYRNALSYYVVIEKSENNDSINVIVCDNWGKILGSTGDISYTEFFANNKVNISIEDEQHTLCFKHSDVIVSDAFFDAFIKEPDFNRGNDGQNQTYESNSNYLLSLKTIKEYTYPLLTNGAYEVKNKIGSSFVEISEFYIDFTLTNKMQDLNKIPATVVYQYIYNDVKKDEQDYGLIVIEGSLDGEEMKVTHINDTIADQLISEYWSIVQAHSSEYLRLNENRNDCWYSTVQQSEINYIYANWENPEFFTSTESETDQVNSTEKNPLETEIDYRWYIDYNYFYNDKDVTVEIVCQNDVMLMVTLYLGAGEIGWTVAIDSVEIGSNGELIYSDGNSFTLIYYSDDHHIYIGNSEGLLEGEYYS